MSDSLPWEELTHTADLRLRARGRTRTELFVHAALGMLALMRYPAATHGAPLAVRVELTSLDWETTLVDWLGELLYLADAHQAQWRHITIERLEAECIASQVEGIAPIQSGRLIKAVTFHDLAIQPCAEGWEVTLTFDV